MSVRALNKVAVERDEKAKDKEKKEKLEGEGKGYLDYLVAAIPTEPLALYTFMIAGIVSTIDGDDDPRLTMRWIIFGVTAGFMAAWIVVKYLRRPEEERERALPWPELFAAVFAFGAWALAMPESPLMTELSGDDKTVWTVVITGAGVAAVGLLTGSMTKEIKTEE